MWSLRSGPSSDRATRSENVALLDPTRQMMIQIDVEPLNAGWTYPVDIALIGDAVVVMDRLGEASGSGSPRSPDSAARGPRRARCETQTGIGLPRPTSTNCRWTPSGQSRYRGSVRRRRNHHL